MAIIHFFVLVGLATVPFPIFGYFGFRKWRAYNGSGPLAEQYADDANGLLQGVLAGDETLYFYER